MPELNVPLLRKVMEHIEDSPSEWYQGEWAVHVALEKSILPQYEAAGYLRFPLEEFSEEVEFRGSQYRCKTAYCFAGHAAVMAGASFLKFSDVTWSNDRVMTPEGRQMHARTYAMNVLGLTSEQASMLFAGDNKISDLRRMVDLLIETGDCYK